MRELVVSSAGAYTGAFEPQSRCPAPRAHREGRNIKAVLLSARAIGIELNDAERANVGKVHRWLGVAGHGQSTGVNWMMFQLCYQTR
jgi:hypothetical protein